MCRGRSPKRKKKKKTLMKMLSYRSPDVFQGRSSSAPPGLQEPRVLTRFCLSIAEVVFSDRSTEQESVRRIRLSVHSRQNKKKCSAKNSLI